jgi:flagellar biosynthesis/type III secretory pathway protein FliH
LGRPTFSAGVYINCYIGMGRVIKKDEQSDVTTASLDEELGNEPPPEGTSSRIPAEKVAREESDSSSDGSAPSMRVLRSDQTRTTSEPVLVEPVAPEPDSAPSDAPSEPAEDDEPESVADGEDEEADAPPERTDAEWRDRLEEAVEEARAEGYDEGREDGYEAGYDEGYEDAETTLRAEWEEERETLIEDITRFEDVWTQYIDENESRFVELTLQLAEAIVDAPIADSLRRTSEEALSEAVAELAGAPPITVTVHPVDYQRFQESGLADHLTDKYDELQLESEPERVEGDWTVSSPAGAVRRRRREVIDTLRSHLSLTASDSDET